MHGAPKMQNLMYVLSHSLSPEKSVTRPFCWEELPLEARPNRFFAMHIRYSVLIFPLLYVRCRALYFCRCYDSVSFVCPAFSRNLSHWMVLICSSASQVTVESTTLIHHTTYIEPLLTWTVCPRRFINPAHLWVAQLPLSLTVLTNTTRRTCSLLPAPLSSNGTLHNPPFSK